MTCINHLSIHYYALSLNGRSSKLFEGFRDSLIDIQTAQFPIDVVQFYDDHPGSSSSVAALKDLMAETDHRFHHFFSQDPLKLLLVGPPRYLSMFKSVTMHGKEITGELEGDYSLVSIPDLGKLIWPIVKSVLAGTNERSLKELEDAAQSNEIVIGFAAVRLSVHSKTVLSLYVEEDYHRRKGIQVSGDGMVVMPENVLDEVFDDEVDALADRVLAKGGDVVFLEGGTMGDYQRIALIRRN